MIGVIEEGLLKGRRVVIPEKETNEVFVESGAHIDGTPRFVRSCLDHKRMDIPSDGCPDCKKEE